METRWSWVKPLHSTVASSEIRDIYRVIEVRKLGFEPKKIKPNLPLGQTNYNKKTKRERERERERERVLTFETKA